jgi:hypothetical protein
MLLGSCLCGEIQFEINGKLYEPLNCHCSMCRKAQGAAFRSRARVRSGDFRWIAGERLLTFLNHPRETIAGSAVFADRPF